MNMVNLYWHTLYKKYARFFINMKKEVLSKKNMVILRNAAFVLAAIAVVRGAIVYWGDSVHASNTVGNRELPIYCVETDDKKVALTFDAAWGNEDTARILEILKKNNVKVTFFMTGGWVESYPEDVKAILAAGHDLGNHSENHKNMSRISDEEKKDELMKVHKKVQELTGYEMFLFRPPYGDYDNAVVNVAKECGYYPIQWDVDSLDWKDYGVDSIVKTVIGHKHLGNGSIILCHNGDYELVYGLNNKMHITDKSMFGRAINALNDSSPKSTLMFIV